MTKVRRLSGFQHTFTFSSQTEQFDIFYSRFLESDLGMVYIAVPWDELVTAFKLGEPKKGPRSFSAKGKLTLMLLKNYSGFSDRKLMEQLNGNLDRPIVRGKEKKPVEFGAKLHKFPVDGIGFIEHLSFDAFHEGIRFRKTVLDIQGMTRTKVKIAGADAIYATNKNRRFATGNGIRTDFKRKGRAGKHEGQRKKMAAAITKERASRLEGSFGTELKKHVL